MNRTVEIVCVWNFPNDLLGKIYIYNIWVQYLNVSNKNMKICFTWFDQIRQDSSKIIDKARKTRLSWWTTKGFAMGTWILQDKWLWKIQTIWVQLINQKRYYLNDYYTLNRCHYVHGTVWTIPTNEYIYLT